MSSKKLNILFDRYCFPVFILFIIITIYWDSPIRKLISITFPLLVIVLYRYKLLYQKIRIVYILIFLYVLNSIISSVLSITPVASTIDTMKIVLFFFFLIAFHKWLDNYKKLIILLKSLMFVGLILSFSILFDRILGNSIIEKEGTIRSGGFILNVNNAGYICFVSMVFSFILYLIEKRKKYLFAILFIFVGMLLTGSRASMLSVFVALLFYLFRMNLPKKAIKFILFGVVLIGILGVYFKEQIVLKLRLNRGSSGRDVLVDISTEIIRDNPYFGIGFGNLREYGTRYIQHYDISEWRKEQFIGMGIQSSHNAFLETTIHLGVFGGIIFVLIICNIGYNLYRRKRSRVIQNRNIYFGIWGLFGGIVIRCFFESGGIITRGWMAIDLPFWIAYILFLKINDLNVKVNA